LGDTRQVDCSAGLWNIKYCSIKRVLTSPDPAWKQAHICTMEQIPQYQSLRPTLAPFGDLTYPPFGSNRHRPYWAVLGEYEYLPPERWLHNTEHGFVAFLYRPCIDPADLCKIKQFIMSRPYDNTGMDSSAGPFRWLLTPYKNLTTKFAVVTYPATLLTDCFHWDEWNEFIDKNYRQSLEDFSLPGRYDYLRIGNSTCPGYEAIVDSQVAPVFTTVVIGAIIAGGVIILLLIVIAILLFRPRGAGDNNYHEFSK